MIKFSLLIPCTTDRLPMLGNLLSTFEKQLPSQTDRHYSKGDVYEIHTNTYGDIELIICMDDRMLSVGEKRNILMELAKGEYLAGFDSDDLPTDFYISEVMKGVEKGVDGCSLKGLITIDGGEPEVFEHSLKYKAWKTNAEGSEIRYERFFNHLNAVKSLIAKRFKYPKKNHGEDFAWSTELHNSGLLKTEYIIEPIIYHYNYLSNKK